MKRKIAGWSPSWPGDLLTRVQVPPIQVEGIGMTLEEYVKRCKEVGRKQVKRELLREAWKEALITIAITVPVSIIASLVTIWLSMS